MPKLHREKIQVTGTSDNFEERYEQALAHLNDESIDVVSVNVLNAIEESGSMTEEYMVFYRYISIEKEEDFSSKYVATYPLYTLDEIKRGVVPPGKVITILDDGVVIYEGLDQSLEDVVKEMPYWEKLSKIHSDDGQKACPLLFEVQES